MLLLFVSLGGLLAAVLFNVARTGDPSTFLIIGVDQRPDETGPTRSDVILLMHSDPAREHTVLVSIPRDLWLPQPGGTSNRINTALVVGYDPSDPDAGPHYLEQTLATNFDIPIDGYFLLNFSGFMRIVDAVGGVDVDVPLLIVDESYPTEDYGTQTIRFEPGPQHLNAEQALIYVRTRHQDSDFGRAARQQQIIQALVQKLMRPGNWGRIPAVLLAVQSSTQTDVALADIPSLVLAAYFLATDRADMFVLNEDYVEPWITEGGAYVLLPRWDVIHQALRARFTDVAGVDP